MKHELKKMYLSAAVPAVTKSQRTLNSNPVPIVIQVRRVIYASLFLVYVLCLPTQWQLDWCMFTARDNSYIRPGYNKLNWKPLTIIYKKGLSLFPKISTAAILPWKYLPQNKPIQLWAYLYLFSKSHSEDVQKIFRLGHSPNSQSPLKRPQGQGKMLGRRNTAEHLAEYLLEFNVKFWTDKSLQTWKFFHSKTERSSWGANFRSTNRIC